MNKTNLFASTQSINSRNYIKKQIRDTQKRTDMTLGIKKTIKNPQPTEHPIH